MTSRYVLDLVLDMPEKAVCITLIWQSLRMLEKENVAVFYLFFFALLQYDIEFKGDDFTEKKNLDMLSKSLRKEIHNLGITWSNSGKQTQCVCITRSYLLVKGRNGGRQTQRSCIEQSCLRLRCLRTLPC